MGKPWQRPWWRWAAIALVAGALVVLSRVSPAESWMHDFIAWAERRGFAGMAVFSAAYILSMIACLWGTPFTLAAGVAFGIGWGTVVATFSATAGSAIAFLIARYVARDAVEKWANRNPKFKVIDAAIQRRGWKIVFLTRFSPMVPFSVSNYLFGLTKIGFWSFTSASLAAILPGSFVVAYLGHIGRLSIVDGFETSGAWKFVLLGGAVVFTVLLLLYLAHTARTAVAELEAEASREAH